MKLPYSVKCYLNASVLKITSACAAACLLLGSIASAQTVVDSGLEGTLVFDGWEDLSQNAYDVSLHGAGYPGSAPWFAAMVANASGSSGGELMKTSGAGYAAGGSIYSAAPGEYAIYNDTNVLANLETVVFSINASSGVSPAMLSVNGGELIAATSEWNLGSQTADIGGTTASFTTFSCQWDLTSIDEPITSFEVVLDNSAHNPLVQMQLEQSDTYSLISPEVPGAASVLLGDVNQDLSVDFLDISPFISALSNGVFQSEADIDENEVVDFLDIAPFILILSGS